jgi:hypothetical protein
MRGEIRSAGFDLNGCWVPLYNWHKVFAGLFDAQTYAGNEQALQVALGLAGYIDKVFAALNDEQVQQVLACEHGGINESFAELYARTQDKRWLALAQRLYHTKVLTPLAQGRDELANLHSNTQIPKLIGLARLHELTGRQSDAAAVDFFWKRVTQHHSYVIGGNGDREYFSAPDSIAAHITEQTCEACSSYNMLKMTRHLYSWAPDAAYFDYYERTHLNHILAHQNPRTGMFTYMTPLMSGMAREYSSEENDFWCCVLSGMESHAKHGDSIYWENGDTLFVNLYIPSSVEWKAAAARLELNTGYPYEGDIDIKVRRLAGQRYYTLALRIPAWASKHTVLVNGKPHTASKDKGYVLIRRRWKAGDTVRLSLPLELRLEAAAGNDHVVALLRGPMVLAADLGPADKPFNGLAPALVGANILGAFAEADKQKAVYRSVGTGRPGDMKFTPFFAQYEAARGGVLQHLHRGRMGGVGSRFPQGGGAAQGTGRALGRYHAPRRNAAGARPRPAIRHFVSGVLPRPQRPRCAHRRLFQLPHEVRQRPAGAAGQLLGRGAQPRLLHQHRRRTHRARQARWQPSGRVHRPAVPGAGAPHQRQGQCGGALRAGAGPHCRAGIRRPTFHTKRR